MDSNGAPLNSESTKQLLSFFGQAVRVEVLLQQTICTVTDTQNGIFVVEDGDGVGAQATQEELNAGEGVSVGSFRCVIEL